MKLIRFSLKCGRLSSELHRNMYFPLLICSRSAQKFRERRLTFSDMSAISVTILRKKMCNPERSSKFHQVIALRDEL